MTLEEFKASLNKVGPPNTMQPLLQAMWFDGREDWIKAHEIAQDITSRDGCWVHAYLHRKEGDLSNAAYWYALAHRPVSKLTLENEWGEIVTKLLKEG